MSSVSVISPVIICAWPAVAAAVAGAAASMGFNVTVPELASEIEHEGPRRRRVETEVPNSEVLEEQLAGDERIVITRGNIEIVVGRDERGAVSLCVTGEGQSKAELEQIGQEVAGRIVQQFAYHRLVAELISRDYEVIEESVQQDQSIQMRVRLGG